MKTKTLESGDGKRTVYLYDDSGNQVRMTDYDAGGRVTCDCTYQSNESGDVIGWQVYDGAGEMICRFETDYYSPGLEAEHREYDKHGQLVRREVYSYDAENRQTVESFNYGNNSN